MDWDIVPKGGITVLAIIVVKGHPSIICLLFVLLVNGSDS